MWGRDIEPSILIEAMAKVLQENDINTKSDDEVIRRLFYAGFPYGVICKHMDAAKDRCETLKETSDVCGKRDGVCGQSGDGGRASSWGGLIPERAFATSH